MTSRRTFLRGIAGTVATAYAQPQAAWCAGGETAVYLGTDKGAGIYSARWNATDGEYTGFTLAAEAVRPTFFARHPHLPVLYAALEGNGPAAQVGSYQMQGGGRLTELNRVSSHGDSPCYVSVDGSGRLLFCADYAGGSLAAMPIGADGRLGEATGLLQCATAGICGTPGPVKDRQDGSHLHCAVPTPGDRSLVVCDLGTDALLVFPITATGDRPLGKPVRVAARPGSGPRHVLFHPNGRWMYCIHELDCTIDLWDWRGTEATPLQPRAGSAVSTLEQPGSLKGNTAAELQMSADGRFLYSCTRGVNTVEVWTIGTDGRLAPLQRVACDGEVPRMIVLQAPWLLSCNQGSGWTTVFRVNANTGRLDTPARRLAAETPMCALFGPA